MKFKVGNPVAALKELQCVLGSKGKGQLQKVASDNHAMRPWLARPGWTVLGLCRKHLAVNRPTAPGSLSATDQPGAEPGSPLGPELLHYAVSLLWQAPGDPEVAAAV